MNYPLTRKALARVDEFAKRADRLLDEAVSDEDVLFWQHVELMRGDYVRQAFLQDTADRNRWSSVRCMNVGDIRRLVTSGR